MAVIVQKYGGSSVADAALITGVARRIGRARDGGAQVVAVVSAMGDSTDALITLAHSVSPHPHARELDLLLSTGELVSCTLLTMALRELGYAAISLSGPQAGIHTDASYGQARIHRVETERIHRELRQGRIVVVAGFQGITEAADITTLGRGGSDTTAVALAAALRAERCEIYTDVAGIYTADPRLVPEARKLDAIGYEEMLELASLGAKMHPRSIELGAAYQVPIYVASSFADQPGTLIAALPQPQTPPPGGGMAAADGGMIEAAADSGMAGGGAADADGGMMASDGDKNMMDGGNATADGDMAPGYSAAGDSMEDRIKVTGIAYNANVAKITVRGVPDRPGIAAALFEPLAQAGISVDTIVQNASAANAAGPDDAGPDAPRNPSRPDNPGRPDNAAAPDNVVADNPAPRRTDISFTVSSGDLAAAAERVEQTAAELGAAAVSRETGLAMVSIVGSGMTNSPGYAARMFRTLANGAVNIEMITTSEIRISCIIRQEQGRQAVQLLHQGFELAIKN